jgi:hypothetical protein
MYFRLKFTVDSALQDKKIVNLNNPEKHCHIHARARGLFLSI